MDGLTNLVAPQARSSSLTLSAWLLTALGDRHSARWTWLLSWVSSDTTSWTITSAVGASGDLDVLEDKYYFGPTANRLPPTAPPNRWRE